MTIRRLNHAVLYVRDARRSAAWFGDVLGFSVVADAFEGRAVFLRADGSTNDHDLGLFSVGASAPSPTRGTVGLYHLAWQVETIEQLAAMRTRLLEHDALVGESDHGVSRSLYGRDPDGIEFEVMWAAPREVWPDSPYTRRLDLEAELARWAGVDTADQIT